MLTVAEAFSKFKSRLELTPPEQEDASRRQRRIRELLAAEFDVEQDFLTGSYRRHTKTKPLKDVDIFVVLGEGADHYRNEHPGEVLNAVNDVLALEYGGHRVEIQRRSVRVDFGLTLADDLEQVTSFDVTPAFSVDDHFIIPDRESEDWMPTDPKIHETRATEANQRCDTRWKPLVKMIKKWNEHHDKPIRPSFLIEVMSLDLLTTWGGSYPRELKAWFATASYAIDEVWPDPADLGHPVSDKMSGDGQLLDGARRAIRQAEATCTAALNHDAAGHTGQALDLWQGLFGPAFAKS